MKRKARLKKPEGKRLHKKEASADGIMLLDGVPFYKISNLLEMPVFFMTLVSDSDHWLFIASNGGLTAGRRNMNHALFPYLAVDRVMDSISHTGPVTLIRCIKGKESILWWPFDPCRPAQQGITRSIYKNFQGNKIIFEESNIKLGLVFRYSWTVSERFGFIRTSVLENTGPSAVTIRILDGARNILATGLTRSATNLHSSLTDAYKYNERIDGTTLCVYSLTTTLHDRPEPRESLYATVGWSYGLKKPTVFLSDEAIQAFISADGSKQKSPESAAKGVRASYILESGFVLNKGKNTTWTMVFDVDKTHSSIAELKALLSKDSNPGPLVEQDILRGAEKLEFLAGSADGLQVTGRPVSMMHHFANTMFNIMRGGILSDPLKISYVDFLDFIKVRNNPEYEKIRSLLPKDRDFINRAELLKILDSSADPCLSRLVLEYMPLTFSRRHGDPSRPWNLFDIYLKDSKGKPVLSYQGNWRDIFQNWESLLLSYPEYFESAMAKFVNASTRDGYNPYRINRTGIDWEKLEPDDAWAFIGYWGDHQVIYLLRLLEWLDCYFPGKLQSFLSRDIFSYGNVPYKILSYENITANPRATIEFDQSAEASILEREKILGSDARLVADQEGRVWHVNLTEKLIVMLSAKMSNFVPEGGIWMNTQRPEWNDANNALAGWGLSMVTLYQMRRAFAFLKQHLKTADGHLVSDEVLELMKAQKEVLDRHRHILASGSVNDQFRRLVMDGLGRSGSDYRTKVYGKASLSRSLLSQEELTGWLGSCLEWIDHTVKANERPDSLFHSYNILVLPEDRTIGTASVKHLDAMLEGQVAVLSSGLLDRSKSLRLLNSLKKSAMFRPDQYSYMLYPPGHVKPFMERNIIPVESVHKSRLIRLCIEKKNHSIIVTDPDGTVRFAPGLVGRDDLMAVIKNIEQDPEYTEHVRKEKFTLIGLYESVFDHINFTGRSGRMFGYEGIGCIYWHMVAKYLLAVQEICLEDVLSGKDDVSVLAEWYKDIRKGLGYFKTPAKYGAFPTDPYSHTPLDGGARQPGMTGQVKEELITRLGELGVMIRDGKIRISPVLLEDDEFLKADTDFHFPDNNGKFRTIKVRKGSLAFTFCQTPFIYTHSKTESGLKVYFTDGSMKSFSNNILDETTSSLIFLRTGLVDHVEAFVASSL